MKCLLGIDVGTYESKGVLTDHNGQIVARAAVAHEMHIPQAGWAEADAETVWWHDVVVLTRELLETTAVSPEDIAAVSCSAIGPCVLPVDAAGHPLRAGIMYGVDTRATDEIDELNEELGEDWIRTNTGSSLSSQAAGPKVLWIRRNEPEVWRQTRRVMTSTSYLVFRLTGRVMIDHYTAAAYGPLYNLHSLDWDPRSLRLVCDRGLLPDLAWSTETAGGVTSAAAAETGLVEGTPVSVGTADAAAEAVAGGVLDPGDTMLMYGSTSFFIQICEKLVATDKLWATVYLEPGSFALAAGMSTTGALTRWFRDSLAVNELLAEQEGGPNAYEALTEQASAVPPGSEGLMALPYFSGERSPINDPLARGAILGLTLSHTRAHLFRAFLESIAYGIRHNLESMRSAGAAPGRLVAIGGGVHNRLWTQIVSDVTGMDQYVQASPGASYGDCMIASVVAGLAENLRATRPWVGQGEIVRTSPESHKRYISLYPLFLKLYEETRELAHELAHTAQGGD